jgi:hypothetical protein
MVPVALDDCVARKNSRSEYQKKIENEDIKMLDDEW